MLTYEFLVTLKDRSKDKIRTTGVDFRSARNEAMKNKKVARIESSRRVD